MRGGFQMSCLSLTQRMVHGKDWAIHFKLSGEEGSMGDAMWERELCSMHTLSRRLLKEKCGV